MNGANEGAGVEQALATGEGSERTAEAPGAPAPQAAPVQAPEVAPVQPASSAPVQPGLIPVESEAVDEQPAAEASGADGTAAAIAQLQSDLSAIAQRVTEIVRLGDRREQLIDRLHEDIQRLRAGEVAQIQAPVLRELIRSYDLAVTLARDGSAGASDLDLVRRRLLDGLEQSGVRSVQPESGEPFDAALHVAIERVSTFDPALDMTVARTMRAGFVQDGERLLRPADVAVHRCEAQADPEAASGQPVPETGSTTGGGD